MYYYVYVQIYKRNSLGFLKNNFKCCGTMTANMESGNDEGKTKNMRHCSNDIRTRIYHNIYDDRYRRILFGFSQFVEYEH